MSYKAKWGNMGFLVSATKIVPFDKFSTTISLKNNTESDATNVRGKDPQQISFSTTYMRSLGMDPRAKYEEWYNEIGKSYPLYIGDKRFGPEKMTLKSISASNIQLSNNGDFLSIEIAITLEEYQTGVNATGKKTDTPTNTKPPTNPTGTKTEALTEDPTKTVSRDKAMSLHERRENADSEPSNLIKSYYDDATGKTYGYYGEQVQFNGVSYNIWEDSGHTQYIWISNRYVEFMTYHGYTYLFSGKSFTYNANDSGSIKITLKVWIYSDGALYVIYKGVVIFITVAAEKSKYGGLDAYVEERMKNKPV